jgi:hypothetical protein
LTARAKTGRSSACGRGPNEVQVLSSPGAAAAGTAVSRAHMPMTAAVARKRVKDGDTEGGLCTIERRPNCLERR